MGVACPNCGSMHVDHRSKRSMYSEIMEYYECNFCKILFMMCGHVERLRAVNRPPPTPTTGHLIL